MVQAWNDYHKIEQWWKNAQDLAGQLTHVTIQHEKEIEALKLANSELLHFIKMCHNMFTTPNFTDHFGYGGRAKELLSKYSKP